MSRVTFRRRRRAPDRAIHSPLGPFLAMRDSLDVTASRRERARLLRNMYPLEPHHTGRVVGRPGVTGLGAQLASGADVQWIGQFTKIDGTEYSVAIVGGRIFTLNWGTSAWTEVVTAANLATASVTLSTTAKIRCVVFADELIVSDGVNTPFAWDGTTGAGGLTSLTNAPVFYGQPVVHYGKLFGINNANRAEIQWSEEAQPNTGYDAGGYNNAWELRQTDTNALVRLVPTNESLYVFRERSITEIFGEVTTNFSSTGTRESVSSTIGTKAPDSVIYANRYIVFADADGNPYYLAPGGTPTPMFEDFHETLDTFDPTCFCDVEASTEPSLDLIVMGYKGVNDTDLGQQLGFHFEGGHPPFPVSVLTGYEAKRFGILKNADGEPTAVHGTTDGYLLEHKTPDDNVWNDVLPAGTVPISHAVHTNFAGLAEQVESHFDRADFLVFARSDATITVRGQTDQALGDSLVLSYEGEAADWDVAVWDTDVWAGYGIEHVSVGLNEFGRYCGLNIEHEALGERFGFISGQIRHRPLNTYR